MISDRDIDGTVTDMVVSQRESIRLEERHIPHGYMNVVSLECGGTTR